MQSKNNYKLLFYGFLIIIVTIIFYHHGKLFFQHKIKFQLIISFSFLQLNVIFYDFGSFISPLSLSAKCLNDLLFGKKKETQYSFPSENYASVWARGLYR